MALNFTSNNVYTLRLAANITSTGGVTLGETYSTWFTSAYSPFYITADMVRMTEIGSYLNNYRDDVINRIIWTESKKLDFFISLNSLSSTTANVTGDQFDEFKRMYVLCSVQQKLSSEIMLSKTESSKKLGDLTITYGDKPINVIKDEARDCFNRAKNLLINGYQFGETRVASFVKGMYDNSRRIINRDLNKVEFEDRLLTGYRNMNRR